MNATAQNRVSTKHIILIGMFAAILAVMSQLSIPMPSGVPATIQVFAVALCGSVLGWKLAPVSMLVYILVGIIGVPVFANLGAGPGVLFGKTGGFIMGYPFMALLCGFSQKASCFWQRLLLCLSGLIICHLCGILQYSFLTNITFPAAAFLISLPYILKDSILVAVAVFLAPRFRQLK